MISKIYEYLGDRATEKGNRAKKLVNFVIQNNGELTDEERKEVFDLFLLEKKIHTGKVDEIVLTTTTTHDKKQITLLKLHEVKGVNKLLEGQVLEFSKNLTVIYGQNASGKTGYSRILKSLGSSYDEDTEVLGNVLESSPSSSNPSCKVSILEDGETNPTEIEWTGDGTASLPIGLFNSSCVDIGLEERKLTFAPHGFKLFDVVKKELSKLSVLLSGQIDPLSQVIALGIAFKDMLKGLTIKGSIEKLSSATTHKDIDALVTEKEPDLLAQKEKLEKESKELNKELLTTKNELMTNQIAELSLLKGIIEKYKIVFSDENWKDYVENNTNLPKFEKLPRLTLEDIAKKEGVKFYESEEFKTFIKNADAYLIKLKAEEETASCPYCRQKLSTEALQLLKSYQEALHSDTQEKINLAKKSIEDFEQQANALSDFTLNHASFGKNEEEILMPESIKNVLGLKATYEKNKLSETFLSAIDFESTIKDIDDREVALTKEKDQNAETLKTIDSKENKLKEQINDLDDKILYLQKRDDLKKYVDAIKLKEDLSSTQSDLHAVQLSAVLKKAQNELFTKHYDDIFAQERKTLNCPDYIDYKLGVDEGNPAITQSISNNKLKDILSEGEQKSIALAEFITELKVCGNNNPIIFDDPVNSLDHERLDRVARRLVALSKESQTVVFTHNILLFNAFEQINEQHKKTHADFEYIFYSVERQAGLCGKLLKNISPSKETFNGYKAEIEKLLNPVPSSMTESEVSTKGYEYLRPAIELLVEEGMFQRTVKRYKKNVATTNLLTVNGALVDTHKDKVLEIYERCCGFIEGHSATEETVLEPNLTEFKADFEEIKNIRKAFNP